MPALQRPQNYFFLELQVSYSLLWLQDEVGTHAWFPEAVAIAARDGAEPCCYGNIKVKELSEYAGVKDSMVCLFGSVFSKFFLFSCVRVRLLECWRAPYCVMSQSCHDVCQRSGGAAQVTSRLAPASLLSSPFQPHFVLADSASVTTVTSQAVTMATTRCIGVAGIKTVDFTSKPWDGLQKVFISSIHTKDTIKKNKKNKEGKEKGKRFLHF